MAGHVAALRALKATRGFDPFGENADSDDEDGDNNNNDDVEEAGELNSDDERLASAGGAFATAAGSGAAGSGSGAKPPDPAQPLLPPPPQPQPLKTLNTVWNTTCSAVYDDEDAEVFCVRFSPDDTMLAAGCGDGVVRVFATDGGKLQYVLEREAWRPKLPTTSVRFRPPTEASRTRNVLLVGNCDGTLQHWHITSRKCMHTITETDNQVYALDYSPDGKQFASGGKDYTVRVYDEATKSCVTQLCGGYGKPSAGHSNRIFALKFSPDDPQILLSAGWDNTVLVWDLRTEASLLSVYGPHICGDAVDLLGEMVLTGSWRPQNQLELWDVKTGEQRSEVAWKASAAASESCQLYAAQFSKCKVDGEHLIAAGGSGTNELKLFKVASQEPVGRLLLPRGVYGLDFSHNGKTIAVAGGDSVVRMLAVPPHFPELDKRSSAAQDENAPPPAPAEKASQLELD